MDLLPTVLFAVALAAFIGVAIYTIAVPICIVRDYPAWAQKGWKSIPRPVIILGATSITIYVACIVVGVILAILDD
jgi:hypothetical protein